MVQKEHKGIRLLLACGSAYGRGGKQRFFYPHVKDHQEAITATECSGGRLSTRHRLPPLTHQAAAIYARVQCSSTRNIDFNTGGGGKKSGT